MTNPHEVISAFLDDEPFDAAALGAALNEANGRELLLDLIALRHLVQIDVDQQPALSTQRPPRLSLRVLVAAAAVVLALVGGYVAGARRSGSPDAEPPPATRVIETSAGWEDLPAGRLP